MAIYTYDDTFLVEDINNLDDIETKTITEIEKIYNGNDTFVKEQLIITRVYMIVAKENLEGEGYKEKYDLYKKEFEYYRALAGNQNENGGVGSTSWGRL